MISIHKPPVMQRRIYVETLDCKSYLPLRTEIRIVDFCVVVLAEVIWE